ncbi:MAG: bifunctional glutamate N-acetyltransferase/amino-acid acetyltransferase ArgJ [Peptostreptococcaceae bacterium]|nr:bifunctional glutamate N-acetyltransferase/amino-acid acetyltransferase ArgJ [Peptostreptococcaceae bacterium]
MFFIEGGVCAPKGFKASGVHCGMRRNKRKKDLALIVSDVMCNVAAVYTTSKIKGAPIAVTKENIKDGKAKAIICNSGNANTCAPNGIKIAEDTCKILGLALGIDPKDVLVNSTGVIGEEMLITPFETGIPQLIEKLSYEGSEAAAKAIMTTDTIKKELATEFFLGDKKCRIGGIAKGSGMINPNMATMLCFITTDVAITSEMLQKALDNDIKDTFNQISIDGDTSTNDTVAVMANGMAGNEMIDCDNADFQEFCKALYFLDHQLSRNIARDGEGATKLIECVVKGAPEIETARIVSKAVIESNLLKAAIFGEDGNWGRIICAMGYAKVDYNIDKTDIYLTSEKGTIQVCKDTVYFKHNDKKVSQILSAEEVKIIIDLNLGQHEATAYGCDLTYDYVKINGSYRS